MGLLHLGRVGRGCGWLGAVAWVGLCCGDGSAQTRARVKVSAWDAAVAARLAFEAEAAGTHTKAEYAGVMDGFRAIYHGDPGDAHAARAVEQVAQLLAEEGRELGDQKSLKDAAGQYAFLAKAYPSYRVVPVPLAADSEVAAVKATPPQKHVYPPAQSRALSIVEEEPVVVPAPKRGNAVPAASRDDGVVGTRTRAASAAAEEVVGTAPTSQTRDMGHPAVVAGGTAMATVTGIRHWSTATYTRVAIDLAVEGDDAVKYEAARVEHPDRLFFDLHHARLAPGLVGKSFTIPGDGFLTRIRAAPAAGDVTRVVLDVHAVGEYTAFLLPNPLRLIIDIHGKVGIREQGLGTREDGKERVGSTGQAAGEDSVASVDAPVVADAVQAAHAPSSPADVSPEAPSSVAKTGGRAEVSSLPPMPVTDGSAGFGLPAKGAATAKAGAVGAGGAKPAVEVARPRVVISSKPTVAKPVPNAVAKSSADTGSEVAAVSLQPGKVEATKRPTSMPVSSGQPVSSGDNGAAGEHYVPRSKRAAGGSAPARGGESMLAVRTGEVTDSGLASAEDSDGHRASGPAHPSDDRAVARMGHPDSGGVPVTGRGKTGLKAAVVAAAPTEAAAPTADGQTSLVRALGLKIGRIVIDAGHGGHDSGTLGAGGIEEKDVVLDVALRLGKLLHDRLGAEIVYTRADDTFIPLETRTAIANKAQADLFISVHANSSQEASARGVEVYYLNFTSDPEAMKVASRENAVSTQSVHELSDLVKKIALKDKIEESKELAADVDSSLYAGLMKGNEGFKDRGVKKAPFVVLIGANMPSILAEISFVTNPEDAEQLQTGEYRERVAESLYGGVARYAGGINGRPARAKGKSVDRAAVRQGLGNRE